MQWLRDRNPGDYLMKKAILDTDILSEVFKAKYRKVQRRANEYRDVFGHLTISAATVAEIIKGFQAIRDERRLRTFLVFLKENEMISLRADEAIMAGRISGDLQRAGKPIGHLDPFIAATAVVHKLPLVTGNTRHFQRVIDLGYPLELQNWRLPNG